MKLIKKLINGLVGVAFVHLSLFIELKKAAAGEIYIYEHNHSVVEWFIAGNAITATYSTPRKGLEEVGVRNGTVLFNGIDERGRIVGTAYAYKAGCSPAPYEVSGEKDETGKIVLLGPGPIRAKNGCQVIGYSARSPHSKLEFFYSTTRRVHGGN